MLIQADMHTHTIASDHAYSTISENCHWAKLNNIKAIAMTDHCGTMPDAPHIWHIENLHILPRKIDDIIVLKGVETNIINFNGDLDISDNTLENLEWVVASMHTETTPNGSADEITSAYLNLMKNNKYVDLIGHPTMEYFKCDYESFVKAAVEYNKIIEINESSIKVKKGSRENSIEILKLCKKYGARVSVDTDCHFCQLVGKVPVAMEIIKELDFPKELIINSNWEILREWILNKRPNLDI